MNDKNGDKNTENTDSSKESPPLLYQILELIQKQSEETSQESPPLLYQILELIQKQSEETSQESLATEEVEATKQRLLVAD